MKHMLKYADLLKLLGNLCSAKALQEIELRLLAHLLDSESTICSEHAGQVKTRKRATTDISRHWFDLAAIPTYCVLIVRYQSCRARNRTRDLGTVCSTWQLYYWFQSDRRRHEVGSAYAEMRQVSSYANLSSVLALHFPVDLWRPVCMVLAEFAFIGFPRRRGLHTHLFHFSKLHSLEVEGCVCELLR